MKYPTLRTPLLVSLMVVISFFAAWLPISLVRAGRPAQDGAISDEIPRDPPADELRVSPFSTYNGPQLAGPDDPVEVMVELEDPPAIEAYLQSQGESNFTGEAAPQAAAAARAQLARIEQAQRRLINVLSGPKFGAKITARAQRVFNGIGVQVKAGKWAELHALPGVKAVRISSPIYPSRETSARVLDDHREPSVRFINAYLAWEAGLRGEGISIGVIDTGVDYTHATFGGSGDPAVFAANNPTVIGDTPGFPGAKVVGGKDLVGENYNAADPARNTPVPDPDPIDSRSNGHGTATAGIAAGFGVNDDGTAYTGIYSSTLNFNLFRIPPGVAPKASLYSWKVFGSDARGATSSAVVTAAIDCALDPNGDGDFSDRNQVVLLPGGGPFSNLPTDPAITAINNAAQLGVIFVGPTGNGGDTHLAAGGLSTAAGALAVAASAHDGLFYQAVQVNSPADIAGRYPAAVAEFGPALTSSIIGRRLVYGFPADGCAPLTNTTLVNGNIAFLDRGACTLTTKARNAQRAGAVAAIIANNTATLPLTAGDDGTGSDIDIPSFLLEKNAADQARTKLNNGVILIMDVIPGDVFPLTEQADSVASFSPYGGVYPFNILKPDITAPGVNILSPDAGSGNNGFYFTGSSGSAPQVAGVAALRRQKFPLESITNSVVIGVGRKVFSGANSAPPERGPSQVGGGRVDAQAAVTTDASLANTQTLSANNLYGDVIEATGAQTVQRQIVLNWKGASATNYSAAYTGNADLPGVNVSITNPTGAAPPNSRVNIPYVLNINPAALKRNCNPWIIDTQAGNPRHCLSEEQGYITVNTGNNQPVRTPIAAIARPASQMGASQNSLNLANSTGTLPLNLTGQGVNNGPTQPADWRSLVSLFELQGIDPNDSTTPPALDFLDLQHIGARSNFKTAGGVANTRIIFGLSTYGDWASPNQLTFNVFIDANRDGRDDFQLFTTSLPNAQGAPSDVFVTRLLNISTGATTTQFFVNSFSAAMLDTAVFYNNTISLPVSAQALGLTDANGKFDYQVKTSLGSVVIDQSARFTYDATKPGLDFGASTMYFDQPGVTIPVSYVLGDFRAANSEGALLLHHLNTRGNRAQILPANLGREADVAPRPAGNGSTTIADWTQVGRFVVGLDGVNLGNEFQRADNAPRNTSGNGALTISDWVQAGRYAAGLDQPQPAGGPVIPSSPPPQTIGVGAAALPEFGAGQTRALRALNANFTPGQANTLNIELAAQGGENALGFSLNYDPAVLSFVSAEIGGAATGATLLTNSTQTANGRVGIALALPAGQGLAAGARRIVNARFNVAAGATAAMTQVSFGDQPVRREMADVNTNELTASYANAVITIGRTVANVSAASFSGTMLATESIASAFGSLLATRVEAASSQPLPTALAGTTVKVKDDTGTERLSPLFFVSPTQINYQAPPGTAPGTAMVTITSGDGAVSMGNANITTVAPGLFAANANGQGVAAAVVLRARADGSQRFEPVAVFDPARNQFAATPIDLGPESDQVFLILFGTGWRFRSSLAAVTASIGGIGSEALFAGGLAGFVGLDQLNLRLARALAGRGEVDVTLRVDGNAANTVRIHIR